MTHIVQSLELNNYTINIYQDDDPGFAKDTDMLGKFFMCHRRYSFAHDNTFNLDSHFVNMLEYVGAKTPNGFDYMSTSEKSDYVIKTVEKLALILPVYMYVHSGITINTTGFSCSWDSGQIGYIIALKSNVCKEYNIKRISHKTKERVYSALKGEINLFDSVITGDVYYYEILDAEGDLIDSCCGFIGIESCIDEAKANIPELQIAA